MYHSMIHILLRNIQLLTKKKMISKDMIILFFHNFWSKKEREEIWKKISENLNSSIFLIIESCKKKKKSDICLLFYKRNQKICKIYHRCFGDLGRKRECLSLWVYSQESISSGKTGTKPISSFLFNLNPILIGFFFFFCPKIFFYSNTYL